MGGFEPRELIRSVISPPLREELQTRAATRTGSEQKVVIELNRYHADGLTGARERVRELLAGTVELRPLGAGSPFLAARLTPAAITELARADREAAAGRSERQAVHRIWPDFPVRPLTDASAATVKADAARTSFGASGRGVVWAVLDSGIDERHPHFRLHANLRPPPGLAHVDFTEGGKSPLTDAYGHGTHVGGIIAGELTSTRKAPIAAVRRERDEQGDVHHRAVPVARMAGMAPQTSLLSYKVLDDDGTGDTSTIMTALEHVAQVNDYGRNLLVHGVNLSVGYAFNPEWFACGASPLCAVVDRLVRSGVVVVVAAGNTGYGWNQDYVRADAVAAGLGMTINDPGNSALAITVGSTHRDSPHRYGVSYFSSKGPTGDGRAKPDLVAPGERILSCAAGRTATEAQSEVGGVQYVEDSGTSMAAPHVAGCIAGFQSIRREFIGTPEAVKDVFLRSATDLGRVPAFQGHGLVDVLRAIHSV